MKQVLSIFILAGMAPQFAQAVEVRQPMPYNQEATQKLQKKIDSMEHAIQLLTPEFLTVINDRITQGADPNIGYTAVIPLEKDGGEVGNKKIFAPLLCYLVMGPALADLRKLDLTLIEKVTKNALEHGADPNTQDSLSGRFGKSVLGEAIHRGSPAQVQMLLDYGATLSGVVTRRGDTPEIVLERDIMIAKDALPREKNPSARLRTQNDIRRAEQILDILKKATQQKS